MAFLKTLIVGPGQNKFQATNVAPRLPVAMSVGQSDDAYRRAQNALVQQQSYVGALQNQNALGNQNSVWNQENGLAQQLQAMANGQGPNPAQAAFNNQTGQNINNQAALMASQRGVAANPGMLARLAAQQGAATQQQAVGQNAALQAQQQMSAIGALQNQQANLANLSNVQASQQAQGLNAYNQFAQGQQQNLLGQINTQNQQALQGQQGADQINSGVAAGNQQAQSNYLGGILSGAGALGAAAMTGGASKAVAPVKPMGAHGGMTADMQGGGKVPGQGQVPGDSYSNDTVDAVLSPKEIVIPRSIAMHPDAPWLAAKFVAQIKAQHKMDGQKNFAMGTMVDSPEGEAPPQGMPAAAPPQSAGPDIGAILGQATNLAGNFAPVAAGVDYLAKDAPVDVSAMQPGSEMNMQQQSSAQPPIMSALNPPGNVGDDYTKAMGQQKAGIMTEAKAKGDLGKASADVLSGLGQDFAKAQSDYSAKDAALAVKKAAIEKDIQDGKIDSGHLWHSLDTGQKIGTAISLLLGGIGGALTHQANPAQVYLQNAIDNDIKAQQAELGKKENLLARNIQETGNLRDGLALTRANLLEASKIKLQQEADKNASPMAQAIAQQQIGQMNGQIAQYMYPIKLKQQALQVAEQGGNVDPAQLVQHLVPESHQKDALHEIQQAQDAKNSESQMMQLFDQAAKENTILKTGAGLARTPQSILGLKALADPLIHDNEGRINELEQRHVQALFPAAGDLDSKIADKKKSLQAFMEHKKSAPTAKSFGIDLSKFASTTSDKRTQLLSNPQTAAMVQYAEKYPNSPVSQAFKQKMGL